MTNVLTNERLTQLVWELADNFGELDERINRLQDKVDQFEEAIDEIHGEVLTAHEMIKNMKGDRKIAPHP